MSDPRVLLCGPAIDAADPGRSLEMLRSVSLPNAVRYLVTAGKFDAGLSSKTFNVEVGYPREPADLQTLAAWAEVPYLEDARFRDGYDLFALRGILVKACPCDFAVLLRDTARFQEMWPALLLEIVDRPFLARGSNILFNLRDERTAGVLDFAWELYITGSVYGISPYSFEVTLMTAADSLRLERELDNRSQPQSA